MYTEAKTVYLNLSYPEDRGKLESPIVGHDAIAVNALISLPEKVAFILPFVWPIVGKSA